MPSANPKFGTLNLAELGSLWTTSGSNFGPKQPPNWPGVMYCRLSQCGAGVITYGGTSLRPSLRSANHPTNVPKLGRSARLGLISVLSMRYGCPTIDQYIPEL